MRLLRNLKFPLWLTLYFCWTVLPSRGGGGCLLVDLESESELENTSNLYPNSSWYNNKTTFTATFLAEDRTTEKWHFKKLRSCFSLAFLILSNTLFN